ncbi:MAG: FAD-dependent oxidoreductase, partial [Hyphomicrobiales bacterium]|nr:FAD-dependent oxidoreductase [Hyphomicrobiales bacterium]
MRNTSLIYDVVIAGAGPVGLCLACELRLAGPSVLVLEQAEDAGSPLKGSPFGLRGLSAPSLEAFYRRGLLDDIQGMSATSPLIEAFYRRGREGDIAAPHWAQTQQSRRPAGHFAGIQFFHEDIDASKWSWRLPSPAGTRMAVYMESLEAVLAARASAMGVEIRCGRGVDGFDQSDENVTVRVVGGETFRGR